MDRREEYRKKLEGEIARLRTVAEDRLSDARERYPERMEQLESKIEQAKGKLAELAEAGEGQWDAFKRRVEESRKARSGERGSPDR